MRKLLDSISGLIKRELDPFHDAKSALQWLDDLRQDDLSTKLQRIREALATYLQQDRVGVSQLTALMLIDEQTQPTFELVCQQYIQNPRMGKQIEEKLWADIMGHARHMLAAYTRFVRHENPKPEEEGAFARATPVLLARALRYVGLEVKWHCFRFQAPPPNLWAAANQLYRLSEVSGVDSDPVMLYASAEGGTTSCADEFLRIQMLATLNNGNFALRQFDWADRWLGLWSRHIQIERKYRPGIHQFCVNLSEPSGPLKIHGPVEGELIRFWGVADLLAEMNRTMSRLEAGDAPAHIGLGEDARMPACLDFMRQLEILWSREHNQQLKREERFRVHRLVEVVQGLRLIFSAVRADDERIMAKATTRAAPDHDEVMDMKIYGYVTDRTKQKIAAGQSRNHAYVHKAKSIEGEHWMVENESESGFGALITVDGHEGVRLGTLLGVRREEGAHWLIAVVRRLNRTSADQLYVGVQIISAASVSISMKLVEPRTPTLSTGGVDSLDMPESRSGLYIPYLNEGAKQNSVLIHSADYSHGRLYHVVARDRVFVLRLGEVLEKGLDWIWAAAEVVRREA